MSNKIHDKLSEPLDRDIVFSRKVSGRDVQYIEGHAAIRNANKCFGFDGWAYEISQLILTPCGENKNGNKVVSAQAIIKVTALDVLREDVGYGEGIAKSLPAANESAGKEAVTDGLKRALRSYGDQFGNGLYDKRFDHTWIPEPDEEIMNKIDACKTKAEIRATYKKIPANEQGMYLNKCKEAVGNLEGVE